MNIFPSRRIQLLIIGAASTICILWSITQVPITQYAESISRLRTGAVISKEPHGCAGNATLGVCVLPSLYQITTLYATTNNGKFEKILTLSAKPSWRTRGIHAAANLTGLDIQIPPQPPINPNIVNAFPSFGPENIVRPKHGASIAWLAHLDLLKYVVQAGLDTALILEDDADWDVSIKDQMVRVGHAVRNLTGTEKYEDIDAPYGRNWDVLWIGHCAEDWNADMESVVFAEPTVPSHDAYRGFATLSVHRLPEFHRSVFYSHGPVCTFGYAVTRGGAVGVLNEVSGGQGEAFDLGLLKACKTEKLTCISVLPEVMRQYFPPAEFEVKSLVDVGNGVVQTVDGEEVFEGVMGSTDNIANSSRCLALWEAPCLGK